jgi:uncharacterized protein (TIGR02646 family)
LSAAAFWSSVRAEIKADAEELRTRFKGKCAFCESRIEHVSNPHVEHYRPKAKKRFECLMFCWTNWLLSCARCNETKWAHFPSYRGQPCLLNPVEEDPRQHIDFKRAIILGLSARGLKTIQLVGLDRLPLNAARANWLTLIDSLLLLACFARMPEVREESRNLLIWSMQDDAPYSAMVLCYLSTKAPKLVRPTTPHPRIAETGQQERIRRLVQQNADAIAQIR